MSNGLKKIITEDLAKLWGLVKKHKTRVIEGIIISIILFILNSPSLILIITAWILLFYTYETYRMRKEIANQTIIHSTIESTPIISISIDKYPTPPLDIRRCWIKNGGGTAIKIDLKSQQPIEGVTPLFKEIDVLLKDEKIELEIYGTNFEDDRSKDAFLTNVMILPEEEEFLFDLKYNNILYEPYEAQMVLRGGRFALTGKPKKKFIRYD